MTVLRNKAKGLGESGAAETSHSFESGSDRPRTNPWVTGDRVKAHAFFQLTIAEIAAVLGCEPAAIFLFVDQLQEGREAGKAAILKALTDNAVVQQNVRAQLFLFHAEIRSAALASAEAKRAQEARYYAMTREEWDETILQVIARFGIDVMFPEEMKQIRAERGLSAPNGKPNTD
jgi:transposase-like protein